MTAIEGLPSSMAEAGMPVNGPRVAQHVAGNQAIGRNRIVAFGKSAQVHRLAVKALGIDSCLHR